MRPASDADFEPTDPALREDVRRLGRLVGELLVEQNGEAFYARVEAVLPPVASSPVADQIERLRTAFAS